MRKATSSPLDTDTSAYLQKLLTIPDVATILGISRPTVYALINNEGLPIIKLGKRKVVRVVPSSFQQWLKKHERTW